MRNVHLQLLALIVLLTAYSAYVVATKRPRLGLDIQGGMRVVLRAKKEELRNGTWKKENLETIADIIRRRVDSLGVSEPVIVTRPDQDQIIVELPGVRDKQQALDAIQTTARLEFRAVPELEGEWRSEPNKETGFADITGPNGTVTMAELDAKVFSKPPVLAGDELMPNSRPDIGPDGTVIHFEFRGDSKRVFEQFTRSHLKKPLAIFLDKKLISAPIIEDVIPGIGIIKGSFSPDQARTLASQLNAGALPVSLEMQQQQNVEATLGRKAMRQTALAGVVGLAAVLIFMLAWYGMPGILANLALLLYSLFTFGVFVGSMEWLGFPGVTLTVPGIAGFILSIGMAVDANVLIFERLKEERLAGKSIRAAIEAGFKRAFSAIFDSNMCTVITCLILYHFGTGSVRGFAVTLLIGVIISMFTAITCSRTFLLMLSGTTLGQNDSLYMLHRGVHPKLGVTKRMKFWFILSGAIIIPGLLAMAAGGTKYSIEFLGGTEIGAQFSTRPNVDQISRAMAGAGFREVRVLLAEGNFVYVTTPRLSPEDQTKAEQIVRGMNAEVSSVSSISGAISEELRRNALLAVLISSLLIVCYLTIRFAIGGLAEGLKFGVCAIAATLHDVIVLWGLFAILGMVLHWQVDSLYVTAMLTVIGFSTHDTIVIFDRIRENLRHKARGETFDEVVDRSIEQSFARSVNTSLTVVLTLVALLILGGPVVRVFVAALLMGVISGTYSSIFNASPLLVLWRRVAARNHAAEAVPAYAGSAPRPAAPSKPATAPAAGNGDALTESAAAAAKLKAKRRGRRM